MTEMEKDDTILMGEEVAHYNGAYKVSMNVGTLVKNALRYLSQKEALLVLGSVQQWWGCVQS